MNLYLRVYLAGYSGRVLPRWLRRLVARSALHRAWLSGFTGYFEQDGVRYGPANPYPALSCQTAELPDPAQKS